METVWTKCSYCDLKFYNDFMLEAHEKEHINAKNYTIELASDTSDNVDDSFPNSIVIKDKDGEYKTYYKKVN